MARNKPLEDDEVECGFTSPSRFGSFPIMTPKELTGIADSMNRALIRSKMKQTDGRQGNQLKKDK